MKWPDTGLDISCGCSFSLSMCKAWVILDIISVATDVALSRILVESFCSSDDDVVVVSVGPVSLVNIVGKCAEASICSRTVSRLEWVDGSDCANFSYSFVTVWKGVARICSIAWVKCSTLTSFSVSDDTDVFCASINGCSKLSIWLSRTLYRVLISWFKLWSGWVKSDSSASSASVIFLTLSETEVDCVSFSDSSESLRVTSSVISSTVLMISAGTPNTWW